MDSRGGKKSLFRGLGVKVQRVFNYSAIYHIYQKKSFELWQNVKKGLISYCQVFLYFKIKYLKFNFNEN